MTLEEIKALWDAAEADAQAKPGDKSLQAVAAKAKKDYEDAKAAAEVDEDPNLTEDPEEIQEDKLDDKTKAYLAKLRKEAASHRVKNKELASKLSLSDKQKKDILKAAGLLDEEKPEEKLQKAVATTNQLAFRSAILESAIDKEIPKEKIKYYQFLIQEATETLDEGQELSDEKLEEIVKECRGAAGGKKATSTVVKVDKDGKKIPDPNPGDSGQLTLNKFCSLSMVEKSKLYIKSPDVYEQFAKQAKAEGKLI